MSILVDSNFVSEDWDDEDENSDVKLDLAEAKRDRSRSGTAAHSDVNCQRDEKASPSVGSTVRADTNWLEEDWDN
jgi:hypothetical protein